MATSACSVSSACNRTSTPARSTLPRPIRAAGIPVAMGGFHVSGCLSMLDGSAIDLQLCTGFANLHVRRRGGRPLRRRAARRRRGHAQAALQLHERPAGHRRYADPVSAARVRQAHRRHQYELRRWPRLPVPMLVLHHHQRARPQVALPHAGRHREDRSRQLGAEHHAVLHHRRQFRAQQGVGGDLRSPDQASRGRQDSARHR